MEKKEKSKAKVRVQYIVQNNLDLNDITPFPDRAELCRKMEKRTGLRWSKDTLSYHFNKLKKSEFTYKGYTIYMREIVANSAYSNKGGNMPNFGKG